MNQSRTTYQSDYTPFGWLQNNFSSDMNEFCSPENVDECLKYISQEFCALGYPSIYSDNSDCPFAANCDIVKFLNVTFELLRSNNEYIQTKEDLESRNQRLYSDLNAYSRKNSQLKSALEQTERKLGGALEKERQLKEKNEQLLQLLKVEKDETKKLTTQLRQQKIAYQHEIRKYENNMNQIKTKLNQILSDKNPNKKMASISISHTLPRSTGQRGKWRTGSSATTAYEDMYSSVISSYEVRCKDMYKELNGFHQCLESVLLQIFEIITNMQDDLDGNLCSATSKEFILNDIKSASGNVQSFEDKFKYLLSVWEETASEKTKKVCRNLEGEINALKSKLPEYESNKELSQVDESQMYITNINKEDIAKYFAEEFVKKEKTKLEEEKLALSKLHENIEKEKADISAQKVALLKLTIQQRIKPPSWHQTLNTLPSISVITSRNGENKILTSNQLKSSSSSPTEIGQTSRLSPVWGANEQAMDKVYCSKSDTVLLSGSEAVIESPVLSPLSADAIFTDSDLPSWAVKKSEAESPAFDDVQNTPLEASQNISSEELELPNESSSEEINLLRLKAAVEDIEKRRINIS